MTLFISETFKKDPKNVLAMNSVSKSDFNNCVVSRSVINNKRD